MAGEPTMKTLRGQAPSQRHGPPCLQVEPHRYDDHRETEPLQPLLDDERSLVVQQSIPERVFFEDELPSHEERPRISPRELGSNLLQLDGHLRSDGEGAGRRELERLCIE